MQVFGRDKRRAVHCDGRNVEVEMIGGVLFVGHAQL